MLFPNVFFFFGFGAVLLSWHTVAQDYVVPVLLSDRKSPQPARKQARALHAASSSASKPGAASPPPASASSPRRPPHPSQSPSRLRAATGSASKLGAAAPATPVPPHLQAGAASTSWVKVRPLILLPN